MLSNQGINWETIRVKHTILVVDVGNSRAKFGVFEHGDNTSHSIRLNAISLRTHRSLAGKLEEWAAGFAINASIVAGSNPPVLKQLVEDWGSSLPKPTVIDRTAQLPVVLNVDQPDAVGMDRVLNAMAANHLYPNQTVIVVDSGTTTTVDLVSDDGAFQGGSIFPGLRLSACALHDYTARLPLIDVDAERPMLPQLPGKNTEEAIRAGLYWGQLGAIREIVQRLAKSSSATPHIIVTGGAMPQLLPHLENAVGIDSLPLHGLSLLFK
jgi:type III pantothenate kinase